MLPHHEGVLSIFANNSFAYMDMQTRSSGTTYRHPVVHVTNVDFRVDYGWYSHIMHDTSLSRLNIVCVPYPQI